MNRFKKILLSFLMNTHVLYASTTGNLPFNTALDRFKDGFYSWIFVGLVILWASSCLMLAFGEWTQSIAKLLNFIFWGSLACAGPTLASSVFNVGACL